VELAAPVINVNWFEARATTALPTSSVVPIRPRGVRRSQSSVHALSTLEIISCWVEGQDVGRKESAYKRESGDPIPR
jgi:hypothetical protein